MKINYLLEFYIYYFEKIFNENKKKKNEVWNKIKHNEILLNYSIQVIKDKFKSNIICYKILTDKTLYNTKIYNELVSKIYDNKKIAISTPYSNCNDTFLFLTFNNKDLKLNKKQKIFLIYEAEDAPYTKKYYDKNLNYDIGVHGFGICDIRFKILQNSSFSVQERKNLFKMFYPDDDLKIAILKELEWEIEKELQINEEELYTIDEKSVKEKLCSAKKITEILKNISLCKYYKTLIPEALMKKYINND